MSKLKLDLHPIYNKGYEIDKQLKENFFYALDNNIKTLEIIPGKGSGQLKKKVIRFLQSKEIKGKFHRYTVEHSNWGRIFVHFKTK